MSKKRRNEDTGPSLVLSYEQVKSNTRTDGTFPFGPSTFEVKEMDNTLLRVEQGDVVFYLREHESLILQDGEVRLAAPGDVVGTKVGETLGNGFRALLGGFRR